MRWWGALVLLVALTACDGSADAPWADREYVALGDSYTAAPGTGENDGTHCYQSARNYPRLVADELDLDLTDASCGGARTHHLTETQERFVNPPQLDALSESTDLVTLRIGANDAALYAYSVVRCTQLAPRALRGTPCADQAGAEYLDTVARQLRAALDAGLAEIADRAPSARVLVVGYPEWAPPAAPEGCEQLPLAEGDYAFARRANELLVRVLEDAAAAAGVGYVDVWAATRGHHMCAEDPWVAGMEPVGGAAAVHPYPREQQVVADRIVALLDS